MKKIITLLIILYSAISFSAVIDNQHDLIIDGESYTSDDDDCLTVRNSSNILIRNSMFFDCFGVGVAIENSTNIRVRENYFENLNGGVYAINSKTIKVRDNEFKNVSRIDHLDESRGQFVQFNNVTGLSNLIDGNVGINEPGNSDPEDAVNLYASKNVTVSNNCLKGGGPSDSGGGIMAGDNGGSNQIIRNNILVDVGQYGIGVAGGNNIQVIDNFLYGRQQDFTNVGMYVWNQSDGSCSNITVQGNTIDFTNSNGDKNNLWTGDGCGDVTGENDNIEDIDLSGMDCFI